MAKKKSSSKKASGSGSSTIALNKRAKHDYFIEERFEAGIALEGWEVKSLRAGKANIAESYIIFQNGEAFLFGAHFSPLPSASTHITPDPTRTRKLLLHNKEIGKIFGAVQKKGYTCVALALYWKKHLVKCEIGLAKGKHLHDKRAADKERDWGREKQRIVRQNNR